MTKTGPIPLSQAVDKCPLGELDDVPKPGTPTSRNAPRTEVLKVYVAGGKVNSHVDEEEAEGSAGTEKQTASRA